MDLKANNFGLRLRGLLERKRVGPEAFAETYGIGRSTVFNWLRSDGPPPRKHWPRLADYFGISQSYLVSGNPDSPSSLDFTESSDPTAYGSPDAYKQQLRIQLEEFIELAEDQPSRLGWLLEQMRAKLQPPDHWTDADRIREEIIRESLAREAAEDAKKIGQHHGQSERPTTQGGAGR